MISYTENKNIYDIPSSFAIIYNTYPNIYSNNCSNLQLTEIYLEKLKLNFNFIQKFAEEG